jgi:transcription-repair coupling factor (superfamily II helicase)
VSSCPLDPFLIEIYIQNGKIRIERYKNLSDSYVKEEIKSFVVNLSQDMFYRPQREVGIMHSYHKK